MYSSFRALMNQGIDYAGLFPPAELSMKEAIHNFVRYRDDSEAWMLSRFICPASRLKELAPFGEKLFAKNPPYVFSVLARSGGSGAEYAENLRKDLQDIAEFREKFHKQVRVDILESKFSGDIYDQITLHRVLRILNETAELIDQAGPPEMTPFFEAVWDEDWEQTIPIIIEALSALNKDLADSAGDRRCRPAGLKLRCGGLNQADFPSPEKIGFAVTECWKASVPLKATAGLHHPFRHLDDNIGTKMHGFINLFVAAVLSRQHDLPHAKVQEILQDEDPSHFQFAENEFKWGDLTAQTNEIKDARHSFFLSFGSCSFDEPRADLKSMNLL